MVVADKTRVLILGGGFGGLYAALQLEKLRDPRFEVTVVNRENFFSLYSHVTRDRGERSGFDEYRQSRAKNDSPREFFLWRRGQDRHREQASGGSRTASIDTHIHSNMTISFSRSAL